MYITYQILISCDKPRVVLTFGIESSLYYTHNVVNVAEDGSVKNKLPSKFGLILKIAL